MKNNFLVGYHFYSKKNILKSGLEMYFHWKIGVFIQKNRFFEIEVCTKNVVLFNSWIRLQESKSMLHPTRLFSLKNGFLPQKICFRWKKCTFPLKNGCFTIEIWEIDPKLEIRHHPEFFNLNLELNFKTNWFIWFLTVK